MKAVVATLALATTLAACGGTSGNSYCDLARLLQKQSDALGSGLDTTNKATVRTTFHRLRETANRAAAAAPAEIKADARSLAEALSQFVSAMEKIGFDFNKPEALRAQEALNDAKFRAAQVRVDAYGKRACGAGPSPSIS